MDEQNNLIAIDNQSNLDKFRGMINSTQIHGGNQVLCDYCGRTSLNSAKCVGRCVADNDY